MDSNKTTTAIREGKSVSRFSLSVFFIGFAAFILGMAFKQGEIGAGGFFVMAFGLVLMQSSLWSKVANSRSARRFRAISHVIWRNTDGPEYMRK